VPRLDVNNLATRWVAMGTSTGRTREAKILQLLFLLRAIAASKDEVDAKAACELLALANRRLVTCILAIRMQGNTNTDRPTRPCMATGKCENILIGLVEISQALQSTLLTLRVV